jgi:hypothetical protein
MDEATEDRKARFLIEAAGTREVLEYYLPLAVEVRTSDPATYNEILAYNAEGINPVEYVAFALAYNDARTMVDRKNGLY